MTIPSTLGLFRSRVVVAGGGRWQRVITQEPDAPYAQLATSELADDDFSRDAPLPGAMLSKEQAGALYNYLLLARGSAYGVHNPIYTWQLLYDSVKALGELPEFVRP